MQIGSEIAIVKNPFALQGGNPELLGTTTPIVDGAISKLTWDGTERCMLQSGMTSRFMIRCNP